MTRPRRALVRAVRAVLTGAVLTLVVGAVPAAAHDVLTGTTPADASTVARTPAQVVLTFDQPAVAMGTQILVTGPSGQVQTGAARLVDNTVTQDLRPGSPAGAYTVAWRVTSADGHPVSGTFTFTSSEAGTGTPPPAEPVTGTPTTAPGHRWPVVVVAAVVVLALVAVLVALRRRRGRA